MVTLNRAVKTQTIGNKTVAFTFAERNKVIKFASAVKIPAIAAKVVTDTVVLPLLKSDNPQNRTKLRQTEKNINSVQYCDGNSI